MNCLFFSSISNHEFNAEEVIASSLLKMVRNRLDMSFLDDYAFVMLFILIYESIEFTPQYNI